MIPLWIIILVVFVICWSAYYQIMCWRYKISIPFLITKLEDRIMNETIYQLVVKRKYKIKFYYKPKGNDYSIAVKHTNVPKWKKTFLKALIIFHVLRCPAWWYRKVDDDLEEACMPTDDEDDNDISENFEVTSGQDL